MSEIIGNGIFINTNVNSDLINWNSWKNVGIFNGTAMFDVKERSVLIESSGNDCYTLYEYQYFPYGSHIPVTTGQTVTLSCILDTEITTSNICEIYLFQSGGTERMVFKDCAGSAGPHTISLTANNDTYFTFGVGCKGNGTKALYKNIIVKRQD